MGLESVLSSRSVIVLNFLLFLNFICFDLIFDCLSSTAAAFNYPGVAAKASYEMLMLIGLRYGMLLSSYVAVSEATFISSCMLPSTSSNLPWSLSL